MSDQLSGNSLKEVWLDGLKSSSRRSTDFLHEWASSGFLDSLAVWSSSKDQSFPARLIGETERAELLASIADELQGDLEKSGSHRIDKWEKGWGENLERLEHAEPESALIPGYFERSSIVRVGPHFFEVDSGAAEASLLGLLVGTVVEGVSNSMGVSAIHEFGCGTGIHLARLARWFPEHSIRGYDWTKASVAIVNQLRDEWGMENLAGEEFDFFEPNPAVAVAGTDLVLTVAALEQVGSSYQEFLTFLADKKPAVVVNIEPIGELLNLDSYEGQLSRDYFLKRNYLDGFLTHLERLEEKREIKIVHAGRSGLGSRYIEVYSVVVWKFVDNDDVDVPR